MTVRIDVNTRHSWHQLTEFTVGSWQLRERMALIAEAEHRKYVNRATIIVDARDLETGVRLQIVRTDSDARCDTCGSELSVRTG